MTRNSSPDTAFRRPRRSIALGARPSCLFVGDPLSLRRVGLRLPVAMGLEHCQMYDLSETLRDRPHPDVVLSFAITPLFDCLDLAQMLSVFGFRGRQRIVAANLPAPRMICREVSMACPGIDFGLFDPAELQPN